MAQITIKSGILSNIYVGPGETVHFTETAPQFVSVNQSGLTVIMGKATPFYVVKASNGAIFITGYEWETGETVARYEPEKVEAS